MSFQVTLFTLHSTVASVKPQFYWYRRAESSVYQMLFFYTVWEEVCVCCPFISIALLNY